MDCKKLKTDIDKLKSLHDSLRIQLDEMNETMQGDKTGIKKVQKQASELEDQLLEKYLGDFAEKNPELFTRWKLNGRIEGFVDADGDATIIKSISAMPDGGMLVGGIGGALYELRKGEDGKWRLGERIEGFKDIIDGSEVNIFSISAMPDGGMLVGGTYGALYEYRQGEDGKWKLGERIEGFEDKSGDVAYVESIFAMPDGGMLVGGTYGALYEYRQGEDGKWKLGERIEGFEDANGYEADVCSISVMPDGGMLVGGTDALYEYSRPPLTVEFLKENLDKIISKGGYIV